MLRLHFFGEPSIEGPDREPIALQTSKHYEVLAYLWLTKDKLHSRKELADRLWDPDEYKYPRGNLKTALSDLCTKLNDKLGYQVIERSSTKTQFVCEADCEVDVDFFEDLLERAEDLDDDEAFELLNRAVDQIYIDDFMSLWVAERGREREIDWEISFERNRLLDRYVEALERLSDIHRQRKEHQKAIDCCHRILAKKPLREETYQDLIYLYSLAGKLDKCTQIFEELKQILKDVLDSEPS